MLLLDKEGSYLVTPFSLILLHGCLVIQPSPGWRDPTYRRRRRAPSRPHYQPEQSDIR